MAQTTISLDDLSPGRTGRAQLDKLRLVVILQRETCGLLRVIYGQSVFRQDIRDQFIIGPSDADAVNFPWGALKVATHFRFTNVCRIKPERIQSIAGHVLPETLLELERIEGAAVLRARVVTLDFVPADLPLFRPPSDAESASKDADE